MSYLLILTFLFTPTYAIKFSLGGIPTNLLMMWVFFIWLYFLLSQLKKNCFSALLNAIKCENKKILLLITLFFLSGIISLFWGGFTLEKLGQFIVIFLQPITIFFIAKFEFRRNPASKDMLLNSCFLILGITGLYSLLQYLTLLGLSPEWWGNSVEPKRALGFFSHPNFYALWSVPLLAFLIPDVDNSIKYKALGIKYFKIISWSLGAVGLGLSLSRAGWLGLGSAGLVYLLFAADKIIKKIIAITAVIVIIVVVSIPNLRWRVTLPFYGEKSAVSRLSLWQTGWKGIKESPVFGLGLTGFSKNWDRLNIDLNIDRHNFPHNIFLNFWLETGLIGLVSLIGLTGTLIYHGLKNRSNAFKLNIALFLIALVSQGMLDNPYFKNDLAMVFWIFLSLAL